MANLELKGFFENIRPVETVGEKGTRIQNAIFMVPGYVDGFGDKKGTDEFWELQVIGANIDKFDLAKNASDCPKAIVKLYINSRKWFSKDDVNLLKPNYSLSAVVYGVEHIKS